VSSILFLASVSVSPAICAHRGFEIANTSLAAGTGTTQQQEEAKTNKNRIDGVIRTGGGQGIAGVVLALRGVEAKAGEPSLERHATGAQDGKFSFADLPAGKYTLRAEAPGFQAVTREVLLTEGAAAESLQITLQILPVNETVVVSETRTAERLGDLPAQITVLSAQDVSRAATMTLDDFLRRVPSFSLFRRGSSLVSHPTT
jgi:hypothetical protein